MSWAPIVQPGNVLVNRPSWKRQMSQPPKSGRENSWAPIVPTTKSTAAKCLEHEFSRAPIVLSAKSPSAKSLGREISLPPKIQAPIVRNAKCQTGNVRGGNCLSRQMSQAPFVSSANFPGAKCPSAICQPPKGSRQMYDNLWQLLAIILVLYQSCP